MTSVLLIGDRRDVADLSFGERNRSAELQVRFGYRRWAAVIHELGVTAGVRASVGTQSRQQGSAGGNVKLLQVVRNARDGLWFVPLIFAVGGVALNVLTISLDRSQDYELIPASWFGDPEAALAILGTVAASMVSLVATVLAITMVVVQLAMQQFSPRIVQTFLKDKPSQIAIGLFVATFVQSMLSMREVVVDDLAPVVAGLSVLVTYIMVIIDIVVLVVYVHHIGQSLRVSSLIELVGQNTRDLINKIYPRSLESAEHGDPYVIVARQSGVLTMISTDRLVSLAEKARCPNRADPCAWTVRPRRGALGPFPQRNPGGCRL